MTPVFINKIPLINRWKAPLDFGNSWHGKRIFGDNKTWRGLIGAVLVGKLSGIIIFHYLFPSSSLIWAAWLGTLLGFGALAGDAIESFFKRQFGKKPGEKWFPFDQIDFILGAILASLFMIRLPLYSYLITVISYFSLHMIAVYIGYLLKLKDKPI